MLWVWILAVVTVVSFGLQGYLAYRQNRWHGLVLPAAYLVAGVVFLVLNLLRVFPQTEVFGSFLELHGSAGAFAVILKAGFLLTPAAVHIVIYFVCRHFFQQTHNPVKRNKEYKKMLVNDL